MALAYCTACQTTHLPGEHRSPSRVSGRQGGRHLAPKPERSRPVAKQEVTRLPRAGEPGSQTTGMLRKATGITRWGFTGLMRAFRVWGGEARKGIRELVDLESLKGDMGRRQVATLPVGKGLIQAQGQTVPAQMSRGSSVAVIDEEIRDPLIEVSMLESLGFYSSDSSVVVRVATPPPPGIAIQPEYPIAGGKSQIPDIDLQDWRPHIIARSKLGSSRLSTTAIVGLSFSLLVLVAVVASLVRGPGESAVRLQQAVTTAATDLAVALRRLDALLVNPGGEVAESTALLIDADIVARALYDSAAALPDQPQDQATRVLRQTATGIAQSALVIDSTMRDALSYRVILNPLWQSPELAGVTDPTQAAAAIATWQTHLTNMVASMPPTPQLAVHVSQVEAFVASIEAWRISYLDALAASDTPVAEAALADLEGQLAILAQSGEDALTTIFINADLERVRLLDALARITA